MSNATFPPEVRAQYRELLRVAAMQAAFAEVEQRCPKAFTPGADSKMEGVALQAAHVQGWKDCLVAFRVLAEEEAHPQESPYLDMTNESNSDRQ